MGSPSETAPKIEGVFASVGRVLSDAHARAAIFRVTLRPMRLPHNEAGAVRFPFGRNDGEERSKLLHRPQVIVRKVCHTLIVLYPVRIRFFSREKHRWEFAGLKG